MGLSSGIRDQSIPRTRQRPINRPRGAVLHAPQWPRVNVLGVCSVRPDRHLENTEGDKEIAGYRAWVPRPSQSYLRLGALCIDDLEALELSEVPHAVV